MITFNSSFQNIVLADGHMLRINEQLRYDENFPEFQELRIAFFLLSACTLISSSLIFTSFKYVA